MNRPLAKGGIDTCHISLMVHWHDWTATEQKLIAAKRTAQAAVGDKKDGTEFLWFGLVPAEALPYSDGRGMFPYVLKFAGMRLSIGRDEQSNGHTPNAVLKIGSDACSANGVPFCIQQAYDLIDQLRGKITGNKLSRVDESIDLPNVHVSELVMPYCEDRVITRASDWHFHGTGKFSTGKTGASWGKDPMLRIYDKLTECERHRKTAYLDWLIAHRFDGVRPKEATRVEFQMRREYITGFSRPDGKEVDTWSDYEEARGKVLEYLTTSWWRIAEQVPSKGNTTKTKTDPLWTHVQDSFAAQAVTKDYYDSPRIKRTPKRADRLGLGKQALGVLFAAVAEEAMDYIDARQQADDLLQTTIRHYGSDEVIRRLRLAQARHDVETATHESPNGQPTTHAFAEFNEFDPEYETRHEF